MEYTKLKIGEKVKFKKDLTSDRYGHFADGLAATFLNKIELPFVKGKIGTIGEVHKYYTNAFKIKGLEFWCVLEMVERREIKESYEIY